MMATIDSLPTRKVAPGYAEDFLTHRATVEVDYSVHHIGNRFAAAVLRDADKAFFLNYVLVPDVLSVDPFENLYSADIKTTVRLADSRGKTVYQQDRDVPLQLRREELKALGDSSFHYYDSLPVAPGRYKFSVLWENTVSREFTSFEGSVVVPGTDELTLGSLVAAKNMSDGAASAGRRGIPGGRAPALSFARQRFFAGFECPRVLSSSRLDPRASGFGELRVRPGAGRSAGADDAEEHSGLRRRRRLPGARDAGRSGSRTLCPDRFGP